MDLNHIFFLFHFYSLKKSIEIENVEEADFLKNKLCSLLREFKSKKSENAMVGVTVHVDSLSNKHAL